MKHQQVTSILTANGFTSRKQEWQNGKLVITKGYKAIQYGKEVGIDCCFCLDQMDAIIETLNNAGLNASEKFPGGGMVQVR